MFVDFPYAESFLRNAVVVAEVEHQTASRHVTVPKSHNTFVEYNETPGLFGKICLLVCFGLFSASIFLSETCI
jgi:hypothetical protein